jgi:hypothetical protein
MCSVEYIKTYDKKKKQLARKAAEYGKMAREKK